MRDYRSGRWGLALVWGLRASVFPQAFALALPNAIIAFVLATLREHHAPRIEQDEEDAKNSLTILAAFTSVLFYILYFRSTVAYNRWWEGGTLLQQTRGEWFNAYSSLIAFSSTDPSMAQAVEEYHHMLARFMSLLFCSALQQVSPDPDRAFEILDCSGICPDSLEFLSTSSDRVEVILQWIQRSTILNMTTGILPIPPPVMSRAFQEISRGIVNLQNARKIADFPFPFPYAQTSIVMLLIHWAVCPILSSVMLNSYLAAATSFTSIFFLWCMNYTALQLEMPFGTADNDLPMDQMQSDWNKSVGTLLAKKAQAPPNFKFDAVLHRQLSVKMSDGSEANKTRMTVGRFLVSSKNSEMPKKSNAEEKSNVRHSLNSVRSSYGSDTSMQHATSQSPSCRDASPVSSAAQVGAPKDPVVNGPNGGAVANAPALQGQGPDGEGARSAASSAPASLGSDTVPTSASATGAQATAPATAIAIATSAPTPSASEPPALTARSPPLDSSDPSRQFSPGAPAATVAAGDPARSRA